MAQRILIPAIFFLCALTSSAAFAQRPPAQAGTPPPRTQLPQTQARAGVPQTIVLPKIVIAGQKATLAVVDADGRLVPAVDIDLSSGAKVTTDDTGRATFQAPAQSGILTARITETAQNFAATVLALPPNTAKTSRTTPAASASQVIAPSQQLICPGIIALQERFDILGSGFSGEAYLDSVFLGNLPALVLAASPVSLVAQPNPGTSAGLVELAAGLAGGRRDPLPVTVVSLQIVGPASPLYPGESSAFTVRADGSAQRLMLEVRSLTPDVLTLSRGETEYWFTSGGPTNAAKIKLRVVKDGNYSLSARLAAIDATNIEIARQQLLAARQFADTPWQKALDRLMQQMQHARSNAKDADAQHAAHFRHEIEHLLRNRPQDPMASLLRLAWQSLGLEPD